MNNPELFLEITGTIFTTTQANNFVTQLDDVINSLFVTRENIEKKLDKILPFEKKERISILCQKNNIDINDLNLMQKFLSNLKDHIKKLPIINLQIAYDAAEKNIIDISSWFTLNLKQKILINVTINKKLIGGAIIGYNGIYKDYSLKKRLDEKYANL